MAWCEYIGTFIYPTGSQVLKFDNCLDTVDVHLINSFPDFGLKEYRMKDSEQVPLVIYVTGFDPEFTSGIV